MRDEQARIKMLKEVYLPGARVMLLEISDPYSKLRPGDMGTVSFVDDAGTVFVDWDCGSSLGLVYGVDRFAKVHTASNIDPNA